jgi:HOOK protein coiled-coil region
MPGSGTVSGFSTKGSRSRTKIDRFRNTAQVEVYKKQVMELNAKLSSEAERADRIAFDNSKLMEKLEALSVERDRLVIERDALKESNEEMKLIQEVSGNYQCTAALGTVC